MAFAFELRGIYHKGSVRFEPGEPEREFNPGMASVGGLLDWYPNPMGSAHVQLGLGVMSMSAFGSHSSGGAAASDPAAFDGLSGPLGHVGIGWSWRSPEGFAVTPVLDVYRGRASGGDQSFDTYGALLEMGVTWL